LPSAAKTQEKGGKHIRNISCFPARQDRGGTSRTNAFKRPSFAKLHARGISGPMGAKIGFRNMLVEGKSGSDRPPIQNGSAWGASGLKSAGGRAMSQRFVLRDMHYIAREERKQGEVEFSKGKHSLNFPTHEGEDWMIAGKTVKLFTCSIDLP